MNENQPSLSQTSSVKPPKKRNFLRFLLFGWVTVFLVSFSVTAYILMNSYRLTFAGESAGSMQQEFEFLKSELSRKESEIEELKLQLANLEGESSFVNELLNPSLDIKP